MLLKEFSEICRAIGLFHSDRKLLPSFAVLLLLLDLQTTKAIAVPIYYLKTDVALSINRGIFTKYSLDIKDMGTFSQ